MRRRHPLASLVFLASAAMLAACRLPAGLEAKPGRAPRCDHGVCLEVVSFAAGRKTVGVWLDAPPATRLVNAYLIAAGGAPCQGPLPVEWVTIDRDTRRHGPADVAGSHGLVLGFPFYAWFEHAYDWHEMFVDVQLDVAGGGRCVRTRLTDAAGKAAVGL